MGKPQTESRTRSAVTPGGASKVVLGAIGLFMALAIWQFCSVIGVINPRSVPAPTDVFLSLVGLLATASFWLAVWDTISIAMFGIIIVILIATPLAMAIHRSTTFRESTWFLIEFLKPIPPVALIPLGLLLWGPTEVLKLILVVFASLWPLLTQLVYGLREVSGTSLEVSQVYRFSSWQRTSRIVIPSILPFALTGLRISITIALVVAIVVEYIGGVSGLGQELVLAQINGLLAQTYAIIVMTGFLGLLFNAILAALSRPLLFWHASQREKNS